MRIGWHAALLIFAGVALTACAAHIPPEALQLTPESLAQRELQTRRFDTKDEKVLLSAGAAALQDLGFTIEASATDLGVIVASKDLSAVQPGQVTGSIFVGLVTTLLGVPYLPAWDTKQQVRVSLVTRRSGQDREATLVRVTFQRIVWNREERVSLTEPLNDPTLYQEFFEKLSKAVFLDAHEL